MGRLFDGGGAPITPTASGRAAGLDGRLFNAAGAVQPGMEKFVTPAPIYVPPAPTPDPNVVRVNDLVGQLEGQKTGDVTKMIQQAAATPQPAAPKPASLGDIVNKAISTVGQKVLAPFKGAPAAAAPPKPTNLISQIADTVQSAASSIIPGLKPAIKIAKTPAAKGVATGVGTLAVNLLAGLNDPFNHYKTASDSDEAAARAQALKTPNAPNKPVSNTGDFLNDAATGILGRLLLPEEAVGGLFDAAASKVTGSAFKTPAIVSQGAKIFNHGALALFGANVVKDTPQYVQQIVQNPDPTQKFNLATQLLGSYVLLAHGTSGLAKDVPTTKTIKGTTTSVPLDVHAVNEFMNNPNPDITPQQHDALTSVFKENPEAIRSALKNGSIDYTNPDVTVPNVYGQIINYVRAKLANNEPLTPAEQTVQAAVVVSPETLVPKPADLIKDPQALATITKMQEQSIAPPAPAPVAQLATFKTPSLNLQQAPATVVTPGAPVAVAPAPGAPATAPAAVAPEGQVAMPSGGAPATGTGVRAQPTAGLSRVADMTQAAVTAHSPQAFIEQGVNLNPDSLRGFQMTDGSIVNGRGSQPDTVSVLDTKNKQIIEEPVVKVLTDFYHQARGEKVPQPESRVAPAKPAPKQIKAIKTKAEAQKAVDELQKKANTEPPARTKTLKRTPASQNAKDQKRLDELALEHANELRAMHKEVGGVATLHLEGNGAEGSSHTRHSLNSMFYRKFYKEHGKAPTRQDWLDHAADQLKAGKGEGLDSNDPRVAEYQKIDARLNPPQEHQELDLSTIKFKKKDGSESPANLRTVKEGASYLQKTRGSAPFEFTTDKSQLGMAAAIFDTQTKRIVAALDTDNKVNIMHVGHEVAHEIYNDILTDAERTEFAAIVRAEYKGSDGELAAKVIAYNYLDAMDDTAFTNSGIYDAYNRLFEAPRFKDITVDPENELTDLRNLYSRYLSILKKDGQPAADEAVRAAPNTRLILKFFREVYDQVENHTYTDTVMEEIFSDMNGEYVAARTGSWSDQLKTFFSDLWNGIKKAAGANYDKIQDVFRQSYKGEFKERVGKPAEAQPALVRAKAKLDDDPGLWEARFAEAAGEVEKQMDEQSVAEREIFGKQGNPGYKVPPALGSVPIGDTRELFDKESTPGDDHARIVKANPAVSAKAIVENYDGLLELRKLKTEERVHDIFHGMTKEQDKQLFNAAKAYQVGGDANAAHQLTPELSKAFNAVTKLYDAVAQDAYVSGRIRGIRENYITQIWDNSSKGIPETSLTPEQINFLRGASSTSTRFALEKVIKTYNDGIALGLKPKYDKLSDLLREYLLADARAAVGQYLASDMLALGDDHILATDNGLPPGWKAINKLSGLKGYSVNPQAWKALKGLESISAIRENWLGRALVKTSQVSTQIIMAGDFLLLKNYFFDAAKVSVFGALRPLIENSQMTPEIRTNLVALGGLKLSEHGTPEMRGGKLGKVLKVVMNEKKNPYFWADLISFKGGDMLRNGTATMIYKQRVKAGDSPAVAAKAAVKFAQDTFGRQNLIRAGRSQTVQDVMRVAMISPDYTESRFRFMGKAFAGATYKIKDREYRRYTAGFLRYLLFAGLLLEAVNYATSGHSTMQNDPDHKFDVEMHNPDGSKYYVNLLGVVKTDLRFINGMADATKGNFTTLTQFIGNKGSSLERVAQMLITNKDYRGDDIVNNFTDSVLEKWKKLAVGAVNNFIPLPIQGFTQPAALSGAAPKGAAGYVLRTLGFDLLNPKAVPTAARSSLQELNNTKQQVQLDVYSLVRQGKDAQAQAEIDAFNKKAQEVGVSLSSLQNISPTDKQSLIDLGTTAAIDSTKLMASAQKSADAGAKPNPISTLIDYGVGGTTVSSSKSVTGKATMKANAVKAAATRKAKSAGTIKPYKAKKAKTFRIAKAKKPRKLKTFKVKKVKV